MDRKPTKAERKEEARLERERIHRKMASRKRNRNIGLVLVALAVIAAVVVVMVTSGGGSALDTPATLLAAAAAQEKVAGCSTVQQTGNYQNAPDPDPTIDHAHIGQDATVPTSPPLSSYPTIPPASGPHNTQWAVAGVYTSPPDVYQSIHALEHAGVVIWYAPSAAGSPAITQISDFYRQKANVGQSKVVVAPYNFPDQGAQGQLPAGVQMALVAWHRMQTCSLPNLAAAFDFSSQYANTYAGRKYIGVAREANSSMA